MRQSELVAHRRQTAAFIEADPLTVVLNRTVMVDSPAGGKMPAPVEEEAGVEGTVVRDASAQLFIIRSVEEVVPGAPTTLEVRIGPWGSGLQVSELGGHAQERLAHLIGPWNLDLRVGDYLVWQTQRYDVIWIAPDRSYETSAALALNGAA